jgi:hypothetical protein
MGMDFFLGGGEDKEGRRKGRFLGYNKSIEKFVT